MIGRADPPLTTKPQMIPTKVPEPTPKAVQYMLAGIMIGAAAGLTLYTKKTGQLIAQIDKSTAAKAARMPKRKPGPKTKEEYEKTRTRIDNDDFF
eukprot:CAMPEP_0195524266 /NCGR_PEP_ID=MMETSP0794_2-20130614/23987_1 /TAXON_ID=515487 /ORGANISM="Stephanopyxis turris, Strain CCMP 815" /LENGTH=94 /DNA_ID=CAMNT_0040654443 /DNA_START=128 /DNA_END=412 /DNA_ORIENTATION=-